MWTMATDLSRPVIALAVAIAAATIPTTAFALCGDVSGDGRITAIDALTALRESVASRYDPLADVATSEPPDGKLTAADALVVLAHAVARTIPVCAAAEDTRVIVTTASCDFVTGGVAEVDLESRTVVRHRAGAADADAVVRRYDGRLFVLNRFGANTVAELDPSGLATLWECSVGGGANPHDIALVANDRGYVTRYDSRQLAIIDPSAGPGGCDGFLRGTIDLSAQADGDGFPEMDQMVVVGDRLFVALQRLDRNSFFRPAANGALAVIDVPTEQVVGTIELAISNPFAETKGLVYDARTERIYVAGPGRLFTDLTDGGIERVNPFTLASEGVIATGADVGGDLTDLVLVGTARAYALVAGKSFAVSVVELDLQRRAPVAVLASSDQLLSDIEMSETGELWLADRNCFNPGLRVFSIADNRELTETPISAVLGPFNLAFFP